MEKPATNLHDKRKYAIHIRNLKQALNYGLILKQVHIVVNVDQKVWLKPYTDVNTKLSQKPKTNFEKHFFKQMKKPVFGKLWKI